MDAPFEKIVQELNAIINRVISTSSRNKFRTRKELAMRVYSRCVKKNRKDRHRLSTTEHRTSKRTMRWTCLDRICELRKLQKFVWDAWLIKRFRVVLLLLLRLIRRRDGLPRHNLFNNSGLSTGFRVVERNGMQIKFNPLFSISLLANVPGTGN